MPSHQRIEKQKKIALVSSAKNCNKITNMFKKQQQTMHNVVELIKDINLNDGTPIITTCMKENNQFETIKTLKECQTEVTINNCDKIQNTSTVDNLNFGDIFDVLKSKSRLSDAAKYKAIQTEYIVTKDYNFPKEIDGKKTRMFLTKWFDEYKWLAYSKKAEGAFCKYCVIFAHELLSTKLVNKAKTSTWKNATYYFKTHAVSAHHINALIASDTFMSIYEGKQDSINHLINKQLKEDSIRVRNGLISITKTLVLCARQNMALRGHSDNMVLKIENGKYEPENNTDRLGNFNSLLLFRMDSGDNLLTDHMEKSNKNAKHVTSMAQNALLDICGNQIQQQIIDEINCSKYFSIIADETADIAGHEQFSLCIKYIYSGKIYTQFLEFVSVNSTTGEHLAETILKKLKLWNINIKYLRGQSYDGASNMSGCFQGVQSRILEVQPTAVYTHCAAHALNLAFVDSIDNSYIRDAISTVKEVVNFFRESVQRNSVLQAHLEKSSQYKKLHSLCETRWSERATAIKVFISLIKPVFATLEHISTTNVCNHATKSQARSLLLAISQCGFIFGLLTASDILDQINNLSKYLQKANIDADEAYSYIDAVISRLEEKRQRVDEYFSDIYASTLELCDTFGIDVKIPRLVGRQNQRNNVPADSVEEYYRRAIAIPFLDHIISNLKDRFGDNTKVCLKLRHLLAENIIKIESNEELKKIAQQLKQFYESDLINIDLLEELLLWKQKWKQLASDINSKLPKNAIENLLKCNEELFPGIFNLLNILCVLPITTTDCERSFSSLKLILTYLRNTMTQNRLNALALLYIHHKRLVNIENVVDFYINSGKHRI